MNSRHLDSGLEWPRRSFGGEFRCSNTVNHQPETTQLKAQATDVVVLYEDVSFVFRSTTEKLCGLQHKRVDDAWVALWGTPIPKEGRNVFDEFGRAARGDHSGLKDLAGSWSAVIYSASSKQLRIINDCLGTRPIFYDQEMPGSRFSFASDVSHLKDIGNLGTAVSPDALASWIWYGYNIAPTGILGNAKHMEAGSVLLVDSTGRCNQSPYVARDDATCIESREELIDCLERVIGRACEYALESSPCVNLLLSGGWDSRYVLAHLLDQGGDKSNLRLTTVDHYGEAESARKVAQAAGLELEILPGTVYPDDSFEQPFHRTLEGLSSTKHATHIAATRHPGIPAIQGYMGDSLVRAKNARALNLNNRLSIREQSAAIANRWRAIAPGVLRDDVVDEIRERSINLTETILSSPMAGRPAPTIDIVGRQRRYIVNNFLQHIQTNEVYLPFCSWELVSHYLYANDRFLNEELYPEMFRDFYPAIGNVPRHINVFREEEHVSQNATKWARLSAGMLLSQNTSGFLRKWRLAPRIAVAPFRSKQFYVIRTLAAINMQLEIIIALTGDQSFNFRSVFQK